MNNQETVNILQNLLQHPVEVIEPLYDNNKNPMFLNYLNEFNVNYGIVSFLSLVLHENQNVTLDNVLSSFRKHVFLTSNPCETIKNFSKQTFKIFLRKIISLPFGENVNVNALMNTYMLVYYILTKNIDKMVELMYNGNILYRDFGVHSYINLPHVETEVKEAFIVRYLNMIRNGEIEWISKSTCHSWLELDVDLSSLFEQPRNFQEKYCFAWLLEQDNLPNNLNLSDIYRENITETIVGII